MLHRPTEARLGRAVGLCLTTIIGAYCAYVMYMQYGDNKGVESPIAMGSLGVLAASIALGFYFLFVKSNTVDFVVDVETECRKVTWPEWFTVRRSTGQVVVLMIFISLFIFAADLGLGYLRQAVM